MKLPVLHSSSYESMKTPFSTGAAARSRIEGLALLAVVGLLGVLAVVQHRWLGAIAEAERRDLVEQARDKASAIAQDIDRELTRVYLELRVDAKALEPGGGAAFAARLAQWRSESAHEGLVRDVFVASRSASSPATLRRFDAATSSFMDEAWPKELAPVREALDHGVAAPFALPLPLPVSIGTSLPSVMPEIPALVSPVMDVFVSERAPARSSEARVNQVRELLMHHPDTSSVSIVLLDAAWLRERLVGAVASRRLGADGPFEWSVVESSKGARVAGAETGGNASDAAAPLLRVRFDELDQSLLRGVLPGLATSFSSERGVLSFSGSGSAVSGSAPVSAGGSDAGAAPSRSRSAVRVVVQVGGSAGGSGGAAVGASQGEAPWTLRIRHREGSIDAAVRAQKRRNTALSASILGVLGLSAGLVFYSARRLRSLATQQVEFVAAVSHELRTPLAVIRSAADNLADGVVKDDAQARRYGALIRGESVRLADMVEHVLEFAGADSPGRTPRGSIDAGQAVRDAVTAMESLAADRGGAVRVDIADASLAVRGDLSHLTRAVSNLLGNALKYGGVAPRVRVSARRAGDLVEIVVADEGEGLRAEEIPHLFEPFYRGQSASEAQVPGSGLGLALVRRIVESHGGEVRAANGAPRGAVFTVSIPAA